MQTSETIGAISAALAKAQAEIGKALKDSVNPAFKSKYADLSAVWDAWQAVGPAQGLAVVQMPGACVQGVAELTTILSHSSGEFMRATMTLPVSKNDAQGVGSATTYLRRYALAAFVGIAPDDDDGNTAVQASTAPAKPAFAEGPHRNKSTLDTAITAFCTHIAALTNGDDLEAYVTEQHPTLAQYRAHYGRDSEHVAAITKQLATARARVAAHAELPECEGPPPVETQHSWSETTQRLVAECQNRETIQALNAWKIKAKPMLDTLDAIEAAYVRGAVADRTDAINAMNVVTA